LPLSPELGSDEEFFYTGEFRNPEADELFLADSNTPESEGGKLVYQTRGVGPSTKRRIVGRRKKRRPEVEAEPERRDEERFLVYGGAPTTATEAIGSGATVQELIDSNRGPFFWVLDTKTNEVIYRTNGCRDEGILAVLKKRAEEANGSGDVRGLRFALYGDILGAAGFSAGDVQTARAEAMTLFQVIQMARALGFDDRGGEDSRQNSCWVFDRDEERIVFLGGNTYGTSVRATLEKREGLEPSVAVSRGAVYLAVPKLFEEVGA
jgi:hypothetical protein